MVELYEGRLGGGKSYSACVRMIAHLRQGGLVATNVELVWSAIKEYCAKQFNVVLEDDQYISLDEHQIGLFHHHTPSGTPDLPVLVVIDEAHLTFNARDYAKTDKSYRETLVFLTQSRKVHTDIIFISQSVLNMDKQFMRLVQFIWRFRDLAKWKIPGLGIAYPLKQILAVQFDYDGKTILQRSFVRKDPRIFELYRTNSLVRPFPRLEGVTTKRTLGKAKTRSVKSMTKYFIITGILVGIFAAFVLYKKMSKIGTPTAEAAKDSISSGITGKIRPTEANSAETEKKTASSVDAAYEIYAEDFQAWNGPEKSLKTSSDWYQAGEMSGRGFVVAVSPRRAKIALPDGRTGWVIATKDHLVAPVVPTPTATPSPILIVPAPAGTLAPTPTPTQPPIYRRARPLGLRPFPVNPSPTP